MENLCFENIRINGHKPYNLIKMTPALLVGWYSSNREARPNNIKLAQDGVVQVVVDMENS